MFLCGVKFLRSLPVSRVDLSKWLITRKYSEEVFCRASFTLALGGTKTVQCFSILAISRDTFVASRSLQN